jgi:hypothetical protein
MIAKIALLRFLLMADNVICLPREGTSGACRLTDQGIPPALGRLLRRPLRAREIRPRVVSLLGGPLCGMGLPLRRLAEDALCYAKSDPADTLESLSRARSGAIASRRLRPGRKPLDRAHPNSTSIECRHPSTTCRSRSATKKSGMSKHSSRIAELYRPLIGLNRRLMVADVLIANITNEPQCEKLTPPRETPTQRAYNAPKQCCCRCHGRAPTSSRCEYTLRSQQCGPEPAACVTRRLSPRR